MGDLVGRPYRRIPNIQTGSYNAWPLFSALDSIKQPRTMAESGAVAFENDSSVTVQGGTN
jgi:hypothetical protein